MLALPSIFPVCCTSPFLYSILLFYCYLVFNISPSEKRRLVGFYCLGRQRRRMGTYTAVSNRFSHQQESTIRLGPWIRRHFQSQDGSAGRPGQACSWVTIYNLRSLHHLILTTVRFSIDGRLFNQHTGDAFKIALHNASTFTINISPYKSQVAPPFSAPFLCRHPFRERLTASPGPSPSILTQRQWKHAEDA